jgi:hypothetical protein
VLDDITGTLGHQVVHVGGKERNMRHLRGKLSYVNKDWLLWYFVYTYMDSF